MSKRITAITLTFLLALVASIAMAAPQAKAKGKTTAAKPATAKKAATPAAPRLTLVEPVKDFGTVPKGEKLSWSFLVKNTGNADLEIIAAKPACGCTVADFDKVIKPGQTGKVAAAVDTASFTGAIQKAVTLETNDPATPVAHVSINAVVKPYVEAYPVGYVRYNMLQGDTDKQSVTLYSEETEPFEITKIESPAEWVKVDYTKIADPTQLAPNGRPGQNQYRIDITVGGPDAKIGPLADKVKVVTNSKHSPEYFITLSGVVRPRFRVEPSGVNFGEVTPSDTASRKITLRSNSLKAPEAFAVKKAESSVPGVTTTVQPTANKGEFEVTVQIAKDAKAGEVAGEVKIYTNDEVNPVVTVPVKATVKTAATPTASK